MVKQLFSIVLGLSLMLFSSCSFEAPVPDDTSATFFVRVIAHDQSPQLDTLCLEIEGSAMGSPIPQILGITVNNDTLPDVKINYGPNGITFEGWLFPDTVVGPMRVGVLYDGGEVYANIVIPESSDSIFTHADNDTVAHNKDLTVSWLSEAQFFTVDVYTYDTGSTTKILMNDSIFDTTSLTLPAAAMRSDLTRLRVNVFGFNGIIIKQGAVANMEGDGNGFIVTQNYIGDWDCRRLTLYVKD